MVTTATVVDLAPLPIPTRLRKVGTAATIALHPGPFSPMIDTETQCTKPEHNPTKPKQARVTLMSLHHSRRTEPVNNQIMVGRHSAPILQGTPALLAATTFVAYLVHIYIK